MSSKWPNPDSKPRSLSDDFSSPQVIAILLPLTSKGTTHDELVSNLQRLNLSLPSPSESAIFIGLDEDDPLLTQATSPTFMKDSFPSHAATPNRLFIQYFPPTKPTKICHIASELARTAYESQLVHCDYFVLLGDDVELTPSQTWLKQVNEGFTIIHQRMNQRFNTADPIEIPYGFGVVALPDVTFPGFPTFPVVSRVHMDIFNGQLFPSCFINQDADPYVWEVYRSFDARIFAKDVTLHNGIGGDEHRVTRYKREHIDWKYDILTNGIEQVKQWIIQECMVKVTPSIISQKGESEEKLKCTILEKCLKITIDIVVPTFRGTETILDGIISLPVPADCDVRSIIIIDDPCHHQLRTKFEKKHGERVLVRMNEVNRGASFSRNRGKSEATATWILYLDDDVIPDPWILTEYAKSVRKDGDRACGFVGPSILPPACNYLTAGVEMSYLTYFWKVALYEPGGEECPWAVTANVFTRRVKDVEFDLAFLKTGGGEDIHYLRQLLDKCPGQKLLKSPYASVRHPWWQEAQPSPVRFFRWAVSDSLLMEKERHPNNFFYSWPNIWELNLILLVCYLFYLLLGQGDMDGLMQLVFVLCGLWLTEFSCDVWNYMITEPSDVCPTITGWQRVYCSLLSCCYKNFTEFGHIWGPLCRFSWHQIFGRFDWWFNLNPNYKIERRQRELIRFSIFLCVTIALSLTPVRAIPSWFVFGLTSLLVLILLGSFTYPQRVNTIRPFKSSKIKSDSPTPSSPHTN